jgi:hypothetical protein
MKSSHTYRILAPALAALLALLALPARADPLLTSAYETQLENWFGQGDLVFTNIFTKTTGDYAADFHTAVDGLGATFFLMHVAAEPNYPFSNISGSQIVGGYNPQSWKSDGSYNLTPNDSDRTAFIYNLTHGIIQRQNLGSGPGNSGEYQTYNSPFNGPSFGKTDFILDNDLTAGSGKLGNDYMSFGSSYGYGMGDIIANQGMGDYIRFSVSDLEVYTFTRAQHTGGNSVPDSGATLGLLAGAMLGAGFLQRRFAVR